MRTRFRLLAFVVLLVMAAPGFAAQDESQQRDYWRKTFSAQRAEVVNAKEQLDAAKAVQREQRRRDYPGGKAKVAIDRAVIEKRKLFEVTLGEYLRLFEDARKQGAEPGWYRDFEDELPTLIGETEIDTEGQFPDEAQFPEETKEDASEGEEPSNTFESPTLEDEDDDSLETLPEKESSEPIDEEDAQDAAEEGSIR